MIVKRSSNRFLLRIIHRFFSFQMFLFLNDKSSNTPRYVKKIFAHKHDTGIIRKKPIEIKFFTVITSRISQCRRRFV